VLTKKAADMQFQIFTIGLPQFSAGSGFEWAVIRKYRIPIAEGHLINFTLILDPEPNPDQHPILFLDLDPALALSHNGTQIILDTKGSECGSC
jgi:hypothetical protein